MASTYTTNLRLDKQGVGDNDSTWGTVLNTQLDLIEDSVAGHVSVALIAGSNTLSTANGSSDTARNMMLTFSGALASQTTVVAPDVEKLYIVRNNTTGGQTVTFKNSAGTGISIPTSAALFVFCDGTSTRYAAPAMEGAKPVFTSVSASVGRFTIVNVAATISAAHGSFVSVSSTNGTINTLSVPSVLNANAVNVSAGVSATSLTAQRVSVSGMSANGVVSVSALNVFGTVSATTGNITTFTAVGVSTSTLTATAVSASTGVFTSITLNSQALAPIFAYGRVDSAGTLLAGSNVAAVSSLSTGVKRIVFTSAAGTANYSIGALGIEPGVSFTINVYGTSTSAGGFTIETRASALGNYGFSFLVFGG